MSAHERTSRTPGTNPSVRDPQHRGELVRGRPPAFLRKDDPVITRVTTDHAPTSADRASSGFRSSATSRGLELRTMSEREPLEQVGQTLTLHTVHRLRPQRVEPAPAELHQVEHLVPRQQDTRLRHGRHDTTSEALRATRRPPPPMHRRQLRITQVAQAVLGQQRRVPIAGHQVSGMPDDPPIRVRCLHLSQRAPAPPAARRRIRVGGIADLLRPHLVRPVVQPAHNTTPGVAAWRSSDRRRRRLRFPPRAEDRVPADDEGVPG